MNAHLTFKIQSEDDLQLSCCSVCKLGPARWFWAVWSSFPSCWHGEEPVGSGYAASPDEARTAAEAQTGLRVEWYRAGSAAEYHRKVAQRHRQEREAGTAGAQPLEFLWRWYDGYGGISWHRHRIVKRTAKRVYVEADDYEPDRTRTDVRTVVVDREELERNGHALPPAWRGLYCLSALYLKPEKTPARATPECLRVLGLELPCSLDEVRRAYRRLVLETHPDTGGAAADFRVVHDAYQQAQALLQSGRAA